MTSGKGYAEKTILVGLTGHAQVQKDQILVQRLVVNHVLRIATGACSEQLPAFVHKVLPHEAPTVPRV